ncbi:MAG: hypothetical protein HZB68_05245 [Candidatus Aenigmarchaeota archaeon]|nr:hypothetical protein [Candidatus Aenigmarchaeota archaeon]
MEYCDDCKKIKEKENMDEKIEKMYNKVKEIDERLDVYSKNMEQRIKDWKRSVHGLILD